MIFEGGGWWGGQHTITGFIFPLVCGVGLLPQDLQSVHQRIKDNMDVLSHFNKKREEGRERAEYLSLLKSDLCTYYSYNDFLMGNLIELFPQAEVCVRVCERESQIHFFRH